MHKKVLVVFLTSFSFLSYLRHDNIYYYISIMFKTFQTPRKHLKIMQLKLAIENTVKDVFASFYVKILLIPLIANYISTPLPISRNKIRNTFYLLTISFSTFVHAIIYQLFFEKSFQQ